MEAVEKQSFMNYFTKRRKFNSIRTKLLLSFVLVSLLPLLIIGLATFFISKDSLIEAKKQHLKHLVDSAYLLAENLHKQVEMGHLTLEEAQEMFRVALVGKKQPDNTRKIPENSPRIGEGDYFFAYNGEIRAVMHPKNFEGKIMDTPNVEGIRVNREMYNQKEGYYTFMWQNPGESHPRPKIAYIRYFEPWDWIIVMGSYYDDFYKEADLVRNVSFLVWICGIALVVIVSMLISSRFIRQLNVLKRVIDKMGQGDFTSRAEVKSKDELGEMGEVLNKALEDVGQVIGEVKSSAQYLRTSSRQISEGSEQLNQASAEIATSMEDIANGSERQSANLQNLSSYMEELAASLDETSGNTRSVTHIADRTREVSREGKIKIDETVQQMNRIHHTMEQIQNVIQHLSERTKEISRFVTIITEISDQTNLLALNAAIEAARAGEQGRGFAVVADEVRKLAEQSSRSASEIENLIKEIVEEAKRSEVSVVEGTGAVQRGMEVVASTGASFDEIVNYVNKLADEINQVNQAIAQINEGTQEAAKSVSELGAFNEQINSNTQSVSASVEEQAAMTREIHETMQALAEKADRLDQLAAKFKVAAHGN
ncbi:methyl-accepting chemotaxis protein [Bacillaceae bacterium]